MADVREERKIESMQKSKPVEMHEILIGRDPSDYQEFKSRGMGFIGKHLVGVRNEAHMTIDVKMDLARPHVIGIFGKRGQGKSYTMGCIAEELLLLSNEIKKYTAGIIIDTMGIFWSMKSANDRDLGLLERWNMKPRGFEVNVMIPEGQIKIFREKEIPFDSTFSMKPSSLSVNDWALSFNLKLDSEMGILLQKVMRDLRESGNYSMEDIINTIKKEEEEKTIKGGLINRFLIANDWGIFSEKGLNIRDIIKPGTLTIIDLSHFSRALGGWSVNSLVCGLLARRILEERIKSRRLEEIQTLEGAKAEGTMPITWMFIDEAHQFLPGEGEVASSFPLLQWVKEGREPGVSLVLATQMPNKLHQEAISQCDLVISHRLTSTKDIKSLSEIMQTYLKYNITDYFDNLPRLKGAALVLDDNSERIFPVRIRPRMSWHAGGTPIAIKE